MMDPRDAAIDAYLNKVSWAMGGTLAEQQAARDELRAHIAEAAREHEISGLSATEALRKALHELGVAEDVGRAMRSSRGTKATSGSLVQPAGALILEQRQVRNMPPVALLVAFGALGLAAAAAALAFAWPL